MDVVATFYYTDYKKHLYVSHVYQMIGQKMMETYPALCAEGFRPWSRFVKALSNKIRKKRFIAKLVFPD
nr:hypothetical protein BaRGS_008059 [Batillaria attramentaria]